MADLDETLDNIFGTADEPAESTPVAEFNDYSDPAAILENEAYGWAIDVHWVYKHLGDRPNQEKAGGKNGRYVMWKEAHKNPQRFMEQTMPKAMLLLEKAKSKEGGGADEMALLEDQEIKKLETILRRALLEMEATQ